MIELRHLAIFSLVFAWATPAVCDDTDWFKADSTKQLEKIIGKFRENYEIVRLERRAFVCEGTRLRGRKGEIEIAEIRFISCFDKDLAFRAASFFADGQKNENWSQKLLHRGKLHQRFGPFHPEVIEAIEDEDEIRKAQGTTRLFSPIDNSILPAQFLIGQPPFVGSDRKLTAGKLLAGEFGPNGTIIQKVRFEGGIRPVQDEFVWSRVKGTEFYFPVQYEYFYVEDDGTLRRRSLVKTEWIKNGDLIVPSRMKFVDFRPVDSLDVDLSVEYLFGDNIGKSPVIEPSMKDWREPIRVLFDKEWLRRGGSMPLVRPSDKELP